MKILDFIHSTKTQAILSFVVISGVGILLVFGRLSEGINNRILDIALLVATFYFGGSKSSTAKDETINTMANTMSATPATMNTGDININPLSNEKPTDPA